MSKYIDPTKCRVALLAGGNSGERSISLASGVGAQKALSEAGFNVTMLDPAEKSDLRCLIDEPFDVAFLCMHGKYGEDGTLQGMLEVLGLPYTGSGVWSSALSIDKTKAKVFYEMEGIPTPQSVTVYKNQEFSTDDIVCLLGSHCVVKPSTEGSALGVFVVEGISAIEDAINQAFEIGNEILIEKYISGTELTVAVLGNEDVDALPIIQIVPKSEFYDFESKYSIGGSEHICPAPLDEEQTAIIMDYAVRAHKSLSCRGVSRSDFILEDSGVCWILETNTIPGMTETSLLPDAGRAAGISFPELCTKLIELALQK